MNALKQVDVTSKSEALRGANRRRLGSAKDYAKKLATSLEAKKTKTSKLMQPERIAAAIDSVGSMQAEYESLGARVLKIQSSLSDVMSDGTPTELDGRFYKAVRTEKPVHKLKQAAQIHTLLIQLLAQIDDDHKGNGGLFDMILALDTDTINKHFVPLLVAVFEKSGKMAQAENLFFSNTESVVEIVAKPL